MSPWQKRLRQLLPRNEVSFEPEVLRAHAGDKWLAEHIPEAVAFPRSTRSVSALLRFANHNHVAVTPRGAGFGYVGGCVPLKGGIVLSLERMNRIKEISAGDFLAVVQAGVITGKLQEAVERKG